MTKEEFDVFLQENERKVRQAYREFKYHSKEFDKKVQKLLLSL